MRPCSECKGVTWVYDMQGARADCLTCYASGDADFDPWSRESQWSAAQQIFAQLIEECGYNATCITTDIPQWDSWRKVRASYCKKVNNPLIFTVAIHKDGRVWISKTSHSDRYYNIHDPNSISELKEEMIKMREYHDRTSAE